MTEHSYKGTDANDRATGFGAGDDQHEPTLIWSGEHQAWWRAPANGYTNDIFAAGVYPRDEARSHTSHCGPEKRIKLQPAEKMLREHLFGLSQTHPHSVIHQLVAIVPREASAGMLTIGVREFVGGERYARDYEYCDATFTERAREAWREMVRSAPGMGVQKAQSGGVPK